MIRAIIFDFGGVLIDNPAPGMFAHYSKNLGVTIAEFAEVFSEYETDWFKGKFSEDEFWKKVTSKLGVSKPEIESLWFEGVMSTYREKEGMFGLIKDLKKKGYRIALLSNTEFPVMNHIKKQNWPDFELLVYSCEVGMRKPDESIYKYTLEKLGIKPEEAVFIDDKQENIGVANKLGVRGILFKDYEILVKDLKSLGV